MQNTNSYMRLLTSLCSPLNFEVDKVDKDDKVDEVDDTVKEPKKFSGKELVEFLLHNNNQPPRYGTKPLEPKKIHPIFQISMNNYTFTVQYLCTKSLNSNNSIQHFSLFYDVLYENGYGPSYGEICSFDKKDPEVVQRFCMGVLSDILGDSEEETDGLLFNRSMLSSLLIGPELIRAQPSLAVSVMGLILAFLCPEGFDDILYSLMWFTRFQGGNHFRFIGSICVNKVFNLLVKMLSNNNNSNENEVSKLIIDMIKVAYGKRSISAVQGYQTKLKSYYNSIPNNCILYFVDKILSESESRFNQLLQQ